MNVQTFLPMEKLSVLRLVLSQYSDTKQYYLHFFLGKVQEPLVKLSHKSFMHHVSSLHNKSSLFCVTACDQNS